MSFQVITDSTSDLPKEIREEYNIDYVAMNYCIGTDEYVASLDWESHSAKEFYDIMRKGTRITTTQVPRDAYETKFGYYLEKGEDVLYIACSSALSGSVNTARMVASELAEKYKNKVVCVDSLISSLGEGYLAKVAAELSSEGKTVDEAAEYIESIKLTVNQCATVDDLNYLRRAGRVKASKAFFGNLFGVKSILISDVKGNNYAYKKAKGTMGAYREIVAGIKETVVEPESQTLYISHADCIKNAEILRDEILKEIPFKDCVINYIAPIVGASVGPGTVGAYYVGKEVTVEGTD